MRKVASVLSICIIAGLLIVYVPNIIAGAGKIGDTVNTMKTADLPFSKALYAAFLYGTFQLANVAVFVQHAKSFEKPQDAGKSMAVGAVLNALLMIMVVLGIMTVYQNPEMIQQSVPTLFMVQQGVGSKFMTPLISVLIILGAVSTAVNMVAAMVKRIHAGLAERSSRTETAGKPHPDPCRACLLHRGLPYRTVWSADADPEGVQHPGIPGNPGHLGAVRGAHGGDAV